MTLRQTNLLTFFKKKSNLETTETPKNEKLFLGLTVEQNKDNIDLEAKSKGI